MSMRSIVLIDSVVIDAESKAEAIRTLTADEPQVLSRITASSNGRVRLRVLGSTLVGAVNFAIDSLELSYDGVVFIPWHTLSSAIVVNSATEEPGVEITEMFPPDAQAIRMQVTNTGTLDVSNKLTLHVALEAVE